MEESLQPGTVRIDPAFLGKDNCTRPGVQFLEICNIRKDGQSSGYPGCLSWTRWSKRRPPAALRVIFGQLFSPVLRLYDQCRCQSPRCQEVLAHLPPAYSSGSTDFSLPLAVNRRILVQGDTVILAYDTECPRVPTNFQVICNAILGSKTAEATRGRRGAAGQITQRRAGLRRAQIAL